MRAIPIGLNADGENVLITPELRQSTHMHVIGGSGTGKSKFLEWLMRRDIREGHGFCLVDWHGTLYNDVLRYCAHLDVGLHKDFRKIILLNPSKSDYITGFNPFMNQGVDVSVQVQKRIDATIRPWGITDTNQMPTFENVMRALYTFVVEMRETLPNAAQILEYDRPELREYAARVVQEREGKRQLRRLIQTKTFKEWRDFVLSTENRLGRFLGSKTVRRFMGMTEGNIDLIEAMDKGSIILINLGSSGYLDREAARVFASLLLNEFFESAMFRATQVPYGQKPKTFSLYLDEFQEYITDDIGAMLDQVRKGGLHMILAHQHLGHLVDNKRLLKSILTNARIRAVLGGLDYEDASLIANEMFLPDLNMRQIKQAYYHTIHLYDEQTRTSRSRSSGKGMSETFSKSAGKSSGTTEGKGHGTTTGEGSSSGSSSSSGTGSSSGNSMTMPGYDLTYPGVIYHSDSDSMSKSFSDTSSDANSEFFAESFSEFSAAGKSKSSTKGIALGANQSETIGETESTVWVPIPIQELGSETEWSREEKVSRVAEMLKTQQQRHAFIKLDTERTQPLQIPFVETYPLSEESLLEYEEAIYKEQGAIPAEEVDLLLEESETRFLLTAAGVIDILPTSTPTLENIEPKKSAKKTKKNLFNDIDPIGRE